MKLLFDQNISFKIVKKIEHLFPDSLHVKEIRLLKYEDLFIFEYAKHNDFCIVTFDEDFNNLSLLKGYPPKIIWLRTGNIGTTQLAERINAQSETIKNFLSLSDENEYGCIEIY